MLLSILFACTPARLALPDVLDTEPVVLTAEGRNLQGYPKALGSWNIEGANCFSSTVGAGPWARESRKCKAEISGPVSGNLSCQQVVHSLGGEQGNLSVQADLYNEVDCEWQAGSETVTFHLKSNAQGLWEGQSSDGLSLTAINAVEGSHMTLPYNAGAVIAWDGKPVALFSGVNTPVLSVDGALSDQQEAVVVASSLSVMFYKEG